MVSNVPTVRYLAPCGLGRRCNRNPDLEAEAVKRFARWWWRKPVYTVSRAMFGRSYATWARDNFRGEIRRTAGYWSLFIFSRWLAKKMRGDNA